jgi:hypothetical protein
LECVNTTKLSFDLQFYLLFLSLSFNNQPGVPMSFKAISLSLVAAAALLAQPAFAQSEGGTLAGTVTGTTIGGVTLPVVVTTVAVLGSVITASKSTTASATGTDKP